MEIIGDEIKLSTGLSLGVHGGVIGIDRELDIYEGWDGGIDDDKLTSKERVEIANYMISLWTSYRSGARSVVANQNQ